MNNYIFDLYGTLVDIKTDEYSLSFWKKITSFLNERGYSYQVEELKNLYFDLVDKEMKDEPYYEIDLMLVFNYLAGKYANELALYFREASIEYLNCFTNTKEVLNTLKKQGKHIYLLSNAQTCFTLPELRKLELIDYFDDIFISSSYHIKKPGLKFINKLIEKYHLKKEECVMVGNDFSTDISIAKKAGIESVFINTDGYSQDEINSHDLEQVKVIKDIKELLSLYK